MPTRSESLYEAFIYDFKPYFINYPFMAPSHGGQLDGNSILYAGSYGLLCARLFGEYKESAEHSTMLYKLSYLEELPGMITRGPHKWNDPQTHDDYIGLCTLSFLNHSGAAFAICRRGQSSRWSYFREHGTWKEWFNAQFWRIPGVVQHIKLCAGAPWGLLDSFLWAIGVWSNTLGNQSDTSGKILKWHLVSAYEMSDRKNLLCSWAVRKWKTKLSETYPNGMGDVFKVYYGASHKFVTWAQGIN